MTLIQIKAAAAQSTLDRFKDRPFRFSRNDCARLVAYHLRKLGHQVKLPASGSYASARSAARELEARGFASLREAIDSFGFERIAPAAVIAGDIVALPGEGVLGALTVSLGGGRVIGYHQDATGAVVMQPVEYEAAWRVTTPIAPADGSVI